MKTNLEKLQNLCEIVNTRYLKGLNDDDQVSKMFEFEKKQKDAVVLIGRDTYLAIDANEYNKLHILAISNGMIKNEYGSYYFDVHINGKIYKCLINN